MSKEVKSTPISENAIQLTRLLPIIAALITMPDHGDNYAILRSLLTFIFVTLSTLPDHDFDQFLYHIGETTRVIDTPLTRAVKKGLPPRSSYEALNKQWRGTEKMVTEPNEVQSPTSLLLKDLLVKIINYQEDKNGFQLVSLSEELRQEFTRLVDLKNHFQHGTFSPEVRMESKVGVDQLAEPLTAFLTNVRYRKYAGEFNGQIATQEAKDILRKVTRNAYSSTEIAVEVLDLPDENEVPIALSHSGQIPELSANTMPARIALKCITQLYELGQNLLNTSTEASASTSLAVLIDPSTLLKSEKGNVDAKNAAFVALLNDLTTRLNEQIMRDLYHHPECECKVEFDTVAHQLNFLLKLTSISEEQIEGHQSSYICTLPQSLGNTLITYLAYIEKSGIKLQTLP
jgi:hypothetical protein